MEDLKLDVCYCDDSFIIRHCGYNLYEIDENTNNMDNR